MHYIIFPKKTATLFSKHPQVNTGLDSIIEITKEVKPRDLFYRGLYDINVEYSTNDYVLMPTLQNIEVGDAPLLATLPPTEYIEYMYYVLGLVSVDGNVANIDFSSSLLYDFNLIPSNYNNYVKSYYYCTTSSLGLVPGFSSYWTQFNPLTDTPTSSINNSRMLIEFDFSEVNSTVYQSASVVYLNLYSCIAKSVPEDYTFDLHPVSSEWSVGTGIYNDKKTKVGVSWHWKNSTEPWTTEGGDYYTQYSSSLTFPYNNIDAKFNITSIVNLYKNATIENNGFIIKRPTSAEIDYVPYGSVMFYSNNTNTVYLPTAEFLYDDHSYVSSSFYSVNPSGSVSGSLLTGSININIKNLKEKYRYDTFNRFRLIIKSDNQIKTFYERRAFNEIKFLEDSLYYSIVDAYTNRTIIPFSEYTKVSLDSQGHYFDISTSGFMPERFYKVLFKYTADLNEQFFDENHTFKVVRY